MIPSLLWILRKSQESTSFASYTDKEPLERLCRKTGDDEKKELVEERGTSSGELGSMEVCSILEIDNSLVFPMFCDPS